MPRTLFPMSGFCSSGMNIQTEIWVQSEEFGTYKSMGGIFAHGNGFQWDGPGHDLYLFEKSGKKTTGLVLSDKHEGMEVFLGSITVDGEEVYRDERGKRAA